MGNRSRRWIRVRSSDGGVDPINLAVVMDHNTEILQVAARFGMDGDPPTTDDGFVVSRSTPGGGIYNLHFIVTDPSVIPTQDLVCSAQGWQLKKGDTLLILYANTSNIDVEIDICLTEAH